MLIEFRVKNFHSIRDEVTLSMVANRSGDLRDSNVMSPDVAGVPELVKSAAIFGPNGAGKSSLIRAISFMSEFVTNSASGQKPGDEIPVLPFFLDADSPNEPSEFEAIFVASGVRYQYGFSLNRSQVLEEWLFAAPEGRNQTWLDRTLDEANSTCRWKLGSHLKGQKQSIRASTRNNALFLSTGAQLNNPQLEIVWQWFSDTLRAFAGTAPVSEGYTNRVCAEGEAKRARVVEFLRSADIRLEDIRIDDGQEHGTSPANGTEITDIAAEDSSDDDAAPYFAHEIHGTETSIDFPLNMESAGTQYIYAWAGPWIDVLDRGLVLVLDELDSSLHTHLAQHLIRLFHNPVTNPNGAQLIFSTHSTPIMGNRELLRRDQVWFVYKDRHDATRLTAFLEFEPRKGEDREKNYLGGRYGAIPKLPQIGKS